MAILLKSSKIVVFTTGPFICGKTHVLTVPVVKVVVHALLFDEVMRICVKLQVAYSSRRIEAQQMNLFWMSRGLLGRCRWLRRKWRITQTACDGYEFIYAVRTRLSGRVIFFPRWVEGKLPFLLRNWLLCRISITIWAWRHCHPFET